MQASWIGYPGTTGLQAMDYYLSDRLLMPAGEFWTAKFPEKIVRLPCCHALPALPACTASGPVTRPERQGHITFGSFNRPTKISPSMVALWAQVLVALPPPRMLLGAMRTKGKSTT